MIIDQLANIGRYRGMTRGLDVLIDWLAANDFRALECGSHPILGAKVFANVMEPTTRPLEGARYEVHERYFDVQVDARGREAFKVAQGEPLNAAPFDAEQDFALLDATSSLDGDLDEGRFAVFVPGEPHMPTLQFAGDGARPIKKICFKVIADKYFDEVE